MIKVYSHQNGSMVYNLKNVLESCGIQCEIRNDNLARLHGGFVPQWCWIELWILDDARLPQAQEILKEALDIETSTGKPWKCPQCGEESERQFTECWNCGQSRL